MRTNVHPSTRNAVKALVATSLGVVLLTGAGGTFALWSDEKPVPAGTVSSGTLSLQTAAGIWTRPDGTVIADITAYRMVPGDTVTFAAKVTPTIVGDNLKAKLVAIAAGSGTHWTVTTSLPGGDRVLTAADSGKAHDVTVTVSLPGNAGAASQSQVLDLSTFTVALQQVTL